MTCQVHGHAQRCKRPGKQWHNRSLGSGYFATLLAVTAGMLSMACKTQHPTQTATLPASSSATTVAPVVTPSLAPAVRSPAPAGSSATVVAQIGVPGQVTITAGRSEPAAITVMAGRPITWLNRDTVPVHILSNEPGLFDTGDIAPGGQATSTVTAPGYHDWHDATSPSLKGTVRVLP